MLDVGRGHAHQLGESARVQVDPLEVPAHRRAAATAVVAGKARDVVGHDQPVAGREAPDARAHLDHVAHDLVPQHRRGGRGRGDLEEVGAAEPAAAHPQEELARAGRGLGPLAQLDDAAGADRGFHGRVVIRLPFQALRLVLSFVYFFRLFSCGGPEMAPALLPAAVMPFRCRGRAGSWPWSCRFLVLAVMTSARRASSGARWRRGGGSAGSRGYRRRRSGVPRSPGAARSRCVP